MGREIGIELSYDVAVIVVAPWASATRSASNGTILNCGFSS